MRQPRENDKFSILALSLKIEIGDILRIRHAKGWTFLGVEAWPCMRRSRSGGL